MVRPKAASPMLLFSGDRQAGSQSANQTELGGEVGEKSSSNRDTGCCCLGYCCVE